MRKWSNKTAKYKILYRERQAVFNKGPKSTACILCIGPNQTKKPMWVIQHHIKKNPMKDPNPLLTYNKKETATNKDFDKGSWLRTGTHEYGGVKLVLLDINPPPEIPNVKA